LDGRIANQPTADQPTYRNMHGVLIVDKPAGPTSHDVVARVRRATGISRIGHTGTLDPLATGVLALVVGRATRLAQFLSSDEKHYVAGVRLGWATATYDAEERTRRDERGELIVEPPQPPPPAIGEAELRRALTAFVGSYAQLPPPFSAKKIGGTPAYLLARLQKNVELKPAEVTVHALELMGLDEGLATLRIVCSSGFYVRSLAHDMGERLGCGAHLETLRRTRTGDFTEADAAPLDLVMAQGVDALSRLLPLPSLLPKLPRVVVTTRGAERVAHGNALAPEHLCEGGALDATEDSGPVRVFDPGGALLAIGRWGRSGVLQPVVVLV
jgi:tRNA pseudouridine55 synthase